MAAAASSASDIHTHTVTWHSSVAVGVDRIFSVFDLGYITPHSSREPHHSIGMDAEMSYNITDLFIVTGFNLSERGTKPNAVCVVYVRVRVRETYTHLKMA